MNLPNYITLGRIVVVPLLVVVLLTPAGETWFGFSGYALAIVALLIAAANGSVPVSNFGLDYPAFFWRVAEVQTAFANLSSFSLTSNDWKVFGYLVGRGALWVAVITAIWSMYGYFSYFIRERKRTAPIDDKPLASDLEN